VNADPIVQQMIDEASDRVINLRAHLTDRQVILDMIEEERSGMERRQHERGTADRRQEARPIEQ